MIQRAAGLVAGAGIEAALSPARATSASDEARQQTQDLQAGQTLLLQQKLKDSQETELLLKQKLKDAQETCRLATKASAAVDPKTLTLNPQT